MFVTLVVQWLSPSTQYTVSFTVIGVSLLLSSFGVQLIWRKGLQFPSIGIKHFVVVAASAAFCFEITMQWFTDHIYSNQMVTTTTSERRHRFVGWCVAPTFEYYPNPKNEMSHLTKCIKTNPNNIDCTRVFWMVTEKDISKVEGSNREKEKRIESKRNRYDERQAEKCFWAMHLIFVVFSWCLRWNVFYIYLSMSKW